MNIQEIIKFLTDNQIDFVLVGGLAVALHGFARNTMDVDIVMAMESENLEQFIRVAKDAGLRPVLPVPIEALADTNLLDEWYRERNLLAFGIQGPQSHAAVLDILIRPGIPYVQMKTDAKHIAVGPHRIAVASVDHLIAMKSHTGRGKDAIDIDELQKIKAREERRGS